MESESPKTNPDDNLLDKIAADPEIISRSTSKAAGAQIAALADSLPEPPVGEVNEAATLMDGRGGFAAPTLNLLNPIDGGSAAAPVPDETAAAVVKPRRKVWPVAIAAAVAVAALGGGGYYLYAKNSSNSQVAVATPAPTPTQAPSPTPTATPSPTPSPTPVPIPAAVNVTAPAAVPTADHPQAVTVQSHSGLWLRSSANSSNKSNIIGWIPYGGTVSVDAVGAFWWHGTYGGKTGYFASNYTQ
jgi:outer membrane biosynthesis protein TonB